MNAQTVDDPAEILNGYSIGDMIVVEGRRLVITRALSDAFLILVAADKVRWKPQQFHP